ncbi:MAG: hypothetical protein KGO53_08535 [Alphaproteobacteria bacterium]|nr:hypothetical protein [Alphaproteobacteria bacterium]
MSLLINPQGRKSAASLFLLYNAKAICDAIKPVSRQIGVAAMTHLQARQVVQAVEFNKLGLWAGGLRHVS